MATDENTEVGNINDVRQLIAERHQMVLDAIGEDEKTMRNALVNGGGWAMRDVMKTERDVHETLLERCHRRANAMVATVGFESCRNGDDDVTAMHEERRRLSVSLGMVVGYYKRYYAIDDLAELIDDDKNIITNHRDDVDYDVLPVRKKLSLVLTMYAALLCADFDLHEHIYQLGTLKGFDTSCVCGRTRETPLHRAARLGHVKTVDMLLKLRKTTVDAKDANNVTAYAMVQQQRKIMDKKLRTNHCHLARLDAVANALAAKKRYVHARASGKHRKQLYRAEGHTPMSAVLGSTTARRAYAPRKRYMRGPSRRRHGQRNATLLAQLK